ncbi:hypothetical protein BH09BAC6_BH09BAC6_31600 [soil metagenome]
MIVKCFRKVGGVSASYRLLLVACFTFLAAAFTSCGGRKAKSAALAGGAPILLFNGTGASPNDGAAVAAIMDSSHLSYTTVNSTELNGMAQEQLLRYRLLVVPGGNFIDMGNSLKPGTAANIRHAVQHGLNYLGICAGGFLAGKSAYYNGFNLTSGVTFGFYAAENKGVHKAVVAISSPGAPTLDQYWEGGPQLSGWGMVAAKYPDGSPAVTEGKCGSGFVILTGIHAEAPADWRSGMSFNTPAGIDNTYAAKLIRAALNGVLLPHY